MIEAHPETTYGMILYAVRSFHFLIRQPGMRTQTFTSAELATAIREFYKDNLFCGSKDTEKARFIVEFLEAYPDTRIEVGPWQ